jgi:hypothetical protein
VSLFRGIVLLGLALGSEAACAPQSATVAAPDKQIVLVHLKLSDGDMGASGEAGQLFDVEDAVEAALGDKGEFDGNEVGGGFFTLYIYGPDSQVILKAIAPALKNPLVRKGSYIEAGPEADPAKRQRLELPAGG